MSEQQPEMDAYLLQLVISLQAGAMQQMGKVASPLTGKVERDLAQAQHTIDMLGMLEEKTRGNLSEDEQKLLSHILYELRLNYVDEAKKGDEKQSPDAEDSQSQSPETEEKQATDGSASEGDGPDETKAE